MGKMSIPSSPTFYNTAYNDLKGVDYSCDPTEVSRKRTPTGTNMISDNGGNPIKRLGWRVMANIGGGEIYEIIFHESETDEYDLLKIFVLSQTGVYIVATKNGEQEVIHALQATITTALYFMFNAKLYFLLNGKIYKTDGMNVLDASEDVFVPEVTISKNPNGTGGKTLQGINLLTPKRKFSFLGDSTAKVYKLYPPEVAKDDKYKYIVSTDIKVEILTLDGWSETTEYTLPTTTSMQGRDQDGAVQTFSVCEPYITFSAVHAPVVVGQDNVRITFEGWNDSTYQGNVKVGQYKEERADLLSATSCMTYGYVAMDRVFLVGGKIKNRLYYSGVGEPLYYPDTNYLTVGHDSNGVVGLHRVSEYLSAVKGDSAIEGTVFLISGAFQDNEMYFKVTPTSAEVGAVSQKSFATMVDEPLFLTRNGIYSIANYYTTSEKVLRNRGYFVDKKLLKEPNYEKACAITWRRYYLIAVNDHCYILDGRNKVSDRYNNTDYLFESYYWENIPARVWAVHNNDLYFGDSMGRICKFNTDVNNRTAYSDNGTAVMSDGSIGITGGEAIVCEWSTPLDDDGRPQYFKTLNKKGTLLTMQPFERTSAKAYLYRDGDLYAELGTYLADIHTWTAVDFTRFTFNSNNAAKDAFIRKKVGKYKRLQIVVKNDAIYEPFGVLGITKTYVVKNFSKNRG